MILFVGDPHGNLDNLKQTVSLLNPEVVILLGDQSPKLPMDQILSNITCHVWFILGNHDSDRPRWLENHFLVWEQCLHSKVIEVGGQRIAGLGGVFREKIWHPDTGVKWEKREWYIHNTDPKVRFRGGLPLRHWTSIFPEDFERLLDIGSADILITHEAPECHPYGFSEIGDLARLLGVHTIIHGHHHEYYIDKIPDGAGGSIRVIGVNMCDVINEQGKIMDSWDRPDLLEENFDLITIEDI